jgi:hypothetical protein
VYTEPTFTAATAATLQTAGFMGTVTTNVYAQPLYVENGPGGVPVFLVATEQNHLTAFEGTTGAVVWDVGPSILGQPVTSGLPCGNINPLGITGTPFVDTSSGQGVIYFDAMTTPDSNVTFHHKVYAVALSTGTVLSGWPVDVSASVSGFSSGIQHQRGALQLLDGTVFVPYGGLNGDCGNYSGWVVGISTSNPASVISWHTAARGGGIWSTAALPTDGTSLFPVTGNTFSATTWSGGEAVIRLSPGLAFSDAGADYYAPSNWQLLDNSDLDLAGSNDVIFDMPGAAYPHLVAQAGKDGNLYLLNRDNLGGVGAELTKASVSTGALIGSPAVYTTTSGTYVAMRSSSGGVSCPGAAPGNLIVAKVTAGSPPALSVAWCSGQIGLGSPMVTTTDGTSNAIVWAANTALYGFDGQTGAVIVGGTSTTMSTAIQSYNAPISAHGRIAVGVNGALYVFAPP